MGPMKWTKTWWKRPIPLSEVLGEAVRKGFWPTRERLGEKFGVVFSKTVVVTETEHGMCLIAGRNSYIYIPREFPRPIHLPPIVTKYLLLFPSIIILSLASANTP